MRIRMRRLAGATALALAGAGLSAAPAGATGGTCSQDGVAMLCAASEPQQDVLAIKYQITQMDGPGTYTLYYISTSTGASSQMQAVGPLTYHGTATGTLYAGLTDCYNVYLTSGPGTALVAGPVC